MPNQAASPHETLLPFEVNLGRGRLHSQDFTRRQPRIGHGDRLHIKCHPSPSGLKGIGRPLASEQLQSLVFLPPSLKGDSSLRTDKLGTKAKVVFCKPPFLFQKPPETPIFRLKQSRLVESAEQIEVAEAEAEGSPRSAQHSQQLSDETDHPDEQPVRRHRPKMPSTLDRRDMTAKSRARLPPSRLAAEAARLRRCSSAPSSDQVAATSNYLTYFSYAENVEWHMWRRRGDKRNGLADTHGSFNCFDAPSPASLESDEFDPAEQSWHETRYFLEADELFNEEVVANVELRMQSLQRSRPGF